MHNAKIILGTIAVIALVVGFLHWTEANDAKRDAAYNAYVSCVETQYGTTPSSYYEEHGETPYCYPSL